jgi:hypothetical protein
LELEREATNFIDQRKASGQKYRGSVYWMEVWAKSSSDHVKLQEFRRI